MTEDRIADQLMALNTTAATLVERVEGVSKRVDDNAADMRAQHAQLSAKLSASTGRIYDHMQTQSERFLERETLDARHSSVIGQIKGLRRGVWAIATLSIGALLSMLAWLADKFFSG